MYLFELKKPQMVKILRLACGNRYDGIQIGDFRAYAHPLNVARHTAEIYFKWLIKFQPKGHRLINGHLTIDEELSLYLSDYYEETSTYDPLHVHNQYKIQAYLKSLGIEPSFIKG